MDTENTAAHHEREALADIYALALAAIDGPGETMDRLVYIEYVVRRLNGARNSVISISSDEKVDAMRAEISVLKELIVNKDRAIGKMLDEVEASRDKAAAAEQEVERLRGLTQAGHDSLRPGMKLRYRLDGRIYTVQRRVDTFNGGFWDVKDETQGEMGSSCVANANKHDWQIVRESDEDLRGRIADLERELAVYRAVGSQPVDERIETLAREKAQAITVLRGLVDAIRDDDPHLPASLATAYGDANQFLNGQSVTADYKEPLPQSVVDDVTALCVWAADNGWNGNGITAIQFCLRELKALKIVADGIKNPADQPIALCDDGTQVFLGSVAGGGAKEGAWGKLILRFKGPGDAEHTRAYTADDMRMLGGSRLELGKGIKISWINTATPFRSGNGERGAMGGEMFCRIEGAPSEPLIGACVSVKNAPIDERGHETDAAPYLVPRLQPMTKKEFDNLKPGDVIRKIDTGKEYVVEGRTNGVGFNVAPVLASHGVRRQGAAMHSKWSLVRKATQHQPAT